MNEFLRQLWEQVSKLSKKQYIIIGSAVVALVIGIIVATMWSTEKEYIPLFKEQLKLQDASKVTTKLTELGLEYKLGATANDILVPSTDKSRYLLKLAEENTLPKAEVGWEDLLDNKGIFDTPTKDQFEFNKLRGLQTELEKTLKHIDSIEDAKINIVQPKKTVFKEDQKPTTASVIVKIKSGYEIEKDQIRAIRDLIRTAVEGLEPENIKISDTNARDLTRAIEDDELKTLDETKTVQLKFKREEERHLKGKLTSMLEKMLGDGKAIVDVTIDMDFDQKEAVSDVVIPPEGLDHGIAISEKTESEQYEGRDLIEDGEPGVNSNLPPGSPAYPGTENGVLNKYKRDGVIKNYEVTKSKETYVKEQGKIERMTASVVIDGDPEEYNKLQDQILAIAQTAIRYNKLRGDKINLMVYRFKNEERDRAILEMANQKEQQEKMFKIIMGLLCAFPIMLGAVWIIARISRYRTMAKEQRRLEEIAREAEKLRKEREQELIAQNEKMWKEYENRFYDIRNWFPEIADEEEKKQKVQELKLKAHQYASENDDLPPDFEELTQEEKFAYKMAFQEKEEGKLADTIKRLEGTIAKRNADREAELAKLDRKARARDDLEARVKALVEEQPENAIQVIKGWLNTKA